MNKIRDAIMNFKQLRVKDLEGRVRVVEPYALHQGKDSVLLHCFQVEGYSASPNPIGWRNLKLTNIQFVQVLNQTFEIRPDFNPSKFVRIQ